MHSSTMGCHLKAADKHQLAWLFELYDIKLFKWSQQSPRDKATFLELYTHNTILYN